MDLETYIGITIAVVVILALSLAISLKIYGETRWLLGIAMILVGAFTLFMVGIVVVTLLIARDDDINWWVLNSMIGGTLGALATLGTTFKRFRQLGRQGHGTVGSDPYLSTNDTHTMQDLTFGTDLHPEDDGSDSD